MTEVLLVVRADEQRRLAVIKRAVAGGKSLAQATRETGETIRLKALRQLETVIVADGFGGVRGSGGDEGPEGIGGVEGAVDVAEKQEGPDKVDKAEVERFKKLVTPLRYADAVSAAPPPQPENSVFANL